MRTLIVAALALLAALSLAGHAKAETRTTTVVTKTTTTTYHDTGARWHGWSKSPDRVRVVVVANGRHHMYYFDNLAVAHSWLYDKYGPHYKIVSWRVVNGGRMVDATKVYYRYNEPADGPPQYRVYESRKAAEADNDASVKSWAVDSWDDVKGKVEGWRGTHWKDWRKLRPRK